MRGRDTDSTFSAHANAHGTTQKQTCHVWSGDQLTMNRK